MLCSLEMTACSIAPLSGFSQSLFYFFYIASEKFLTSSNPVCTVWNLHEPWVHNELNVSHFLFLSVTLVCVIVASGILHTHISYPSLQCLVISCSEEFTHAHPVLHTRTPTIDLIEEKVAQRDGERGRVCSRADGWSVTALVGWTVWHMRRPRENKLSAG